MKLIGVFVFLVFLGTIIVQNVIRTKDEKKQFETIDTLVRISNACLKYHQINSKLPPSSNPALLLTSISTYSEFKLTSVDGWGWPIRIYETNDRIILWSPGKDGKFWPQIPKAKKYTQSFNDDLICVGDEFKSWPDGLIRD